MEAFLRDLLDHLRSHIDAYASGREVLRLEVSALRMLNTVVTLNGLPQPAMPRSLAIRAPELCMNLSRVVSLALHPPKDCRVLRSELIVLDLFQGLHRLQLVRIKPTCVKNWRQLSLRLTSLTAIDCVASLEELLDVRWTDDVPREDETLDDLVKLGIWGKLKVLNLEGNAVPKIDESLSMLRNVERVNFAHNLLRDISGFQYCYKLSFLTLEGNMINSLEGVVSELGCVRSLVLRNNRLMTIDGIEMLAGLEELDLGKNLIRDELEITRLAKLPILSKVWLDGNPIAKSRKFRSFAIQCFAQQIVSQPFAINGDDVEPKERKAAEEYIRMKEAQAASVDHPATPVSSGRKTPTPTPTTPVNEPAVVNDSPDKNTDSSQISPVVPRLLLDGLGQRLQREGSLTDLASPVSPTHHGVKVKRHKKRKTVARLMSSDQEEEFWAPSSARSQEQLDSARKTAETNESATVWKNRIDTIVQDAGDNWLLVMNEMAAQNASAAATPHTPASLPSHIRSASASTASGSVESQPQSLKFSGRFMDANSPEIPLIPKGNQSSSLVSPGSPTPNDSMISSSCSVPLETGSSVSSTSSSVSHNPVKRPTPDSSSITKSEASSFDGSEVQEPLTDKNCSPVPQQTDAPADEGDEPLSIEGETNEDSSPFSSAEPLPVTEQPIDSSETTADAEEHKERTPEEGQPEPVADSSESMVVPQEPERFVWLEDLSRSMEDPLNWELRDSVSAQSWMAEQLFKFGVDEFFLQIMRATYIRFGASRMVENHCSLLFTTFQLYILGYKEEISSTMALKNATVLCEIPLMRLVSVIVTPSFHAFRLETSQSKTEKPIPEFVYITRTHARTHWFLDALAQQVQRVPGMLGLDPTETPPHELHFVHKINEYVANFTHDILRTKQNPHPAAPIIMLYSLVHDVFVKKGKSVEETRPATLVLTQTIMYCCKERLSNYPTAPQKKKGLLRSISDTMLIDSEGSHNGQFELLWQIDITDIISVCLHSDTPRLSIVIDESARKPGMQNVFGDASYSLLFGDKTDRAQALNTLERLFYDTMRVSLNECDV